MEGEYTFWYCNRHDEGAIVFSTFENRPYLMPEWLNICYDCTSNRDKYCDYQYKGILEYKNKKLKIIEPVQTSFEREAGGWKFEYYVNNVFDTTGKKITSDTITNILLEWFSTKTKE